METIIGIDMSNDDYGPYRVNQDYDSRRNVYITEIVPYHSYGKDWFKVVFNDARPILINPDHVAQLTIHEF